VKGKQRRSDLTLAIEASGMSTSIFATEKLGISYQLFRYRVRQGKLSLEDLWKIFYYTGKTFDQLFPNPYYQKPKAISLTLRPATPKSRLTPAPVERMVPEPKTPAPAPQTKKREPIVIDVYGGGLPPLE
jgi:hypothetical protein